MNEESRSTGDPGVTPVQPHPMLSSPAARRREIAELLARGLRRRGAAAAKPPSIERGSQADAAP